MGDKRPVTWDETEDKLEWRRQSGGYVEIDAADLGAAKINDGAVTTAKLNDGAVTDAKIRDSGACSVIGRSANSSGDPADISAASNNTVLVRKSNTVQFTTIDRAMVTGYSVAVYADSLASGGWTTGINLPTDCTKVRFTIVQGGGGGGIGETGATGSARRGGGGGGSGAWTVIEFDRWVLPDTIEVYAGLGGAGGSLGPGSAGSPSLVAVSGTQAATGYAGTGPLPNAAYLIAYAGGGGAAGGSQGSLGGGGGLGGTAMSANSAMWSKRAVSLTVKGGRTGGTGANTNATPTALNPWASDTANLEGGCGGAGFAAASPAAQNGGGYAAVGPFGAFAAGGTAPGGAGQDGYFGPNGGATTTSTDHKQLAWGYGGGGGASSTTGSGGAGGDGAPGCGGGGGGAAAGTPPPLLGGAGGTGGEGFVVIECW